MDTFEILFGVEESKIQPTCVLLPFVRKDVLQHLGVTTLSRGRRYATGPADGFTVIHTGRGAAALGDAVLYLGETPSQRCLLFGAGGLVSRSGRLKIGSLVSPVKCHAAESFSQLLLKKEWEGEVLYPDRKLVKLLLSGGETAGIQAVTGASVGALKLPGERVKSLRNRGIEVVDMECAALYAAASWVGKPALALLFVTDIIGEKPYYRRWSAAEQAALSTAVKQAASILCGLIKKNLDG